MNQPHPSTTLAHARRIEEASLNAWPALQQLLLDGWLLRFSRGFTKRANCVVPLYPSLGNDADTLLDRVRYCENLYAKEQLETIFRLTSLADHAELDALLTGRGYRLRDPSLVMARNLDVQPQADPDLMPMDLDPWLETYTRLTGVPDHARRLHRLLLQAIRGDCLFALRRTQGRDAACGLVVVEQEMAGLFDIVTDEASRRQGHARHLVTAMLQWAATRGARWAYLQVVADNAPAVALYGDLGFQPCYRYWYRCAI